MAVDQYINHLYSNDLEGYIQILQLENGQVLKMLNTDIKGLVEVVQDQEGQEDTFITPNSFYIPIRSNENIRHFRALYIDLDLDYHSKTEAFYEVYLKAAKGEIPKPSMIVDSGRGLHLYWRIDHAPKGAAYTWQELEDYLYKQLKNLGADFRATDSARVMRLPSTINSRNGGECVVLEDNDIRYSMYELREKYLNYIKKDKPKAKAEVKKSKGKVNNIFSSYRLHITRANDLEQIVRSRSYKVKGYRNSLVHCYCYWKGIYIRDPKTLLEVVEDFNNSFTYPLKDTEVRAIVKSTTKAVESFISYEQGIRSGEDKRVSKAMRSRGGYWYTNETLINMLDITEAEQRELKTIIGTKEKYRRNNEARRKARRNEQGLTSREQSKVNNIAAVKELAEQGLNQLEISKELGLSQSYISELINDN